MIEANQQHLVFKIDLDKGIQKTFLNTLFATDNAAAHQIDIQLFRGNSPLTLPGGATVTGKMLRRADKDKKTVPITGSASGNVASITLNRTAYAMSGAFSLFIDVTIGDVTGTVFHGEGSMTVSATGTIEDDEKIIYNLPDLLEEIDNMRAATNAANTAAGSANTAAQSANTNAAAAQSAANAANTAAGLANAAATAAVSGPNDPQVYTGNPVTLQDQWAGYPFGVKVNVEPYQTGSGDPSPSNVRPIVVPTELKVGRSGRNLLVNGGTEMSSADYKVGEFYPVIPLIAGEKYTATMDVTAPSDCTGILLIMSYGFGHGPTISVTPGARQVVSTTFTAEYYAGMTPADNPGNGDVLVYRLPNNNDQNQTVTIHSCMITPGSTAHAYEPYVGDTYSVSLPTDFGGGVVDVTGGDSTKDAVIYDLTNATWAHYWNGKRDEQLASKSASFLCVVGTQRYKHMNETKMNVFKLDTDSLVIIGAGGRQSMFNTDWWQGTTYAYVSIHTDTIGVNESSTDEQVMTAFKEWIQRQSDNGEPVTLWYKLYTPESFSVTPAHVPALSGTNVITTNGTTLTVSQRQGIPDAFTALQKRIAALEAAAATS